MPHFAGIIYPSALQVTGQIHLLSQVFSKKPTFEMARHKNLELGIWEKGLYSTDKKNGWLLFKGYLVNKKSLKEELKAYGITCQKDCAEEIIWHALELWKEKALRRFEGSFTLSYFDAEKEELYLARDPIGTSPLYWSFGGRDFVFATRLKALLATGLVAAQPSAAALGAYLHFGYFPQDMTPIHQVNKLLPGFYLKINLKRDYQIEQYTSLSTYALHPTSLSESDIIHHIAAVLKQSVCEIDQKNTSVYTPFHLGGQVLSELVPDRTATRYLISSSNKQRQLFEKSCEQNQLPHQALTMTPDCILKGLVDMVYQLDEPIGHFRATWLYHLCQAFQSDNKKAFIPLGWQELFAAKHRHLQYGQLASKELSLAFKLAHLPRSVRDSFLIPLLRQLDSPYRYEILRNCQLQGALVSYFLNSALFPDYGRRACSPYLYEFFKPEVFIQRFHLLSKLPGTVNPSIYFDLKTHLPDRSLFIFSHFLENKSFEMISPFTDPKLIGFMMAVPDSIKYHPHDPGHLLKKALALLNPHAQITQLPKTYLPLQPLDQATRKIFKLLCEGRLVEEGLIEKKWLKLQTSHPTGRTQAAFDQLWAVLILEIWFRLMITTPIGKIETDKISLIELLQQ